VLVFLETGGTWIGAPPEVACFAENTPTGERDTVWLKEQLERLRIKLSGCSPMIVGAAANGVTFQELFTAMDIGVGVGLRGTDIAHPIDLPMQFTMGKQRDCVGTAMRKPTRPPHSRSVDEDPSPMPLVDITSTEIKFGPDTVISVADAMKDSNKNPIPELQRAIPSGSKRVLIRADQRTDAKLLNRVIKSARAAGVDRLAFTTAHEPPRQPQRRATP
jgi:hypothetical protein